jgi:regulator of protease activity HflC (stomatin/prohibitin superfamily)
VLRSGKVVDTRTEPGVVLHLPYPFSKVVTVRTDEVRSVVFGAESTNYGENFDLFADVEGLNKSNEDELVTGEENLLRISFAVHYRVRDPRIWAFGLAEPERLLRGFAESSLRRYIGHTRSDESLIASREVMEAEILAILARDLDAMHTGIEAVAVHILELHAPSAVHYQYRDVASALEYRTYRAMRGRGYATERLARARGESASIETEAHAKAAQVLGKGARRRQRVREHQRGVPESCAADETPTRTRSARSRAEEVHAGGPSRRSRDRGSVEGPPRLERVAHRRVERAAPAGTPAGGRRLMLNGFRLLLLSAVGALLAWACCVQVNEGEVVVVTRFGDPRRTLDEAGLYFTWPAPLDTVVRIDRRVQILDPGSGEYLTKDKKNVIVDPFMAWKVTDHMRFMKTVGSMDGAGLRLTDVLRSITGDVLASHPFSTLVSIEGHSEALDAMLEKLDRRGQTQMRGQLRRRGRRRALEALQLPRAEQAGRVHAHADRTADDLGPVPRGRRRGVPEDQGRGRSPGRRTRRGSAAQGDRNARQRRRGGHAHLRRGVRQGLRVLRVHEGLEVFETMLTSQSTLVIPNDHPLLKLVELSVPNKSRTDDGAPKDH